MLVLAPSTLDPIKGVTNKVPSRVDSVSTDKKALFLNS